MTRVTLHGFHPVGVCIVHAGLSICSFPSAVCCFVLLPTSPFQTYPEGLDVSFWYETCTFVSLSLDEEN